MKVNHLLVNSTLFLLLLFIFPYIGNAQTYVKVISEKAVIYPEAVEKSSPFNISARKGDTFKLINTKNKWIQIQMFTGEKRYINSSQINIEFDRQPFPSDSSIIGDFCNKVENARSKAVREASAKYPNKITKQVTYEDMLFDKYVLMLFREHDIQATHYSKLAVCIDDSIF